MAQALLHITAFALPAVPSGPNKSPEHEACLWHDLRLLEGEKRRTTHGRQPIWFKIIAGNQEIETGKNKYGHTTNNAFYRRAR
jgi:hypothetical protein